MFITATNDEFSISSGIINCIVNPDIKVTMVIDSKRKIADFLYMAKDVLSRLENVQDCDYEISTSNTYFCVGFENGSVFKVEYYQPKGRGKRADMSIIDECIPEEDKMILLDYCDAIDRSSI